MTFAQKRQSYNARNLDWIRKQLAKRGNTPEQFWYFVEFMELAPLDAQELSQQVKWPGEAPTILDTKAPVYVSARAGSMVAPEPDRPEPIPERVPFAKVMQQAEIAERAVTILKDQAKAKGALVIGDEVLVVQPKAAPVFKPPSPKPVAPSLPVMDFNKPKAPPQIPIKDFTKGVDKPK